MASALQSQVVVNENVKHSKYTFPLVASKIKATVCYDANDYPVVKKVAELFVSDIENVTGQRLKLADEWKKVYLLCFTFSFTTTCDCRADATTNNINSEKILIDTVVLVIQFYFFLSSK